MIRLLWLFLIVDILVFLFDQLRFSQPSVSVIYSDIWVRVAIELAALAIIQAIREGKIYENFRM